MAAASGHEMNQSMTSSESWPLAPPSYPAKCGAFVRDVNKDQPLGEEET